MNKRQRIKKNEEFQEVFKKGKSFANRQFVVYSYRKEDQPEFQDWTIRQQKSRKCSARNRIKRYLRQSFLEMKDELRNDMDYVIIARHQAATLDFHETKKSLQHVLRIAKVY